MVDMGKCDDVIYRTGSAVLYTVCPAQEMEAIVVKLREETKQPIDWHYVAGRAVLKTTGDVDVVAVAFKRLAGDRPTRYMDQIRAETEG